MARPGIAFSDALPDMFARQRGHLFPWCAVAYACGIGGYFLLRFEPGWSWAAGVAAASLLAAIMARRAGEVLRPWLICLLCLGLGGLIAMARAHQVAGPVLDWRYYGAVEGRVIAMDRSGSDAVRLTLDQVVLERTPPDAVPRRVRLSLHGDAADFGAPPPGARVMTTAHLGPPGGPVEPGGFDFQRHAWFLELGAVGYTRVPVLVLEPAGRGAALAIFRTRMAISAHVSEVLPGDVGGFAAAVTTGDRSGISRTALDHLRASNTAHLLAISGLHMGLLSGFIFGLLRLSLAAIPYVALRWPTRKLAAGGALMAACAYLALSGGNVSTERAFVMTAVALGAVMLDRRVFSIRSVAIAALIVLTLRPEALLGPGFQMSFAATTALVVVFQALRPYDLGFGVAWLRPVMSVLVSSLVAGLATAPIGAAHFNALAHYGLLANLLSVPVMGVLVVPASVLAAALAPFGLESVGLWLMGLGLQWILGVAAFVAQLDGARSFVPGPPWFVLPLLCLALLFVIQWQGRARWSGLIPACLALGLWGQGERPQVLVAETGNLVGVMTDQGRALSKPRGAGFIADNWLENDGAPLDQERAAEKWPDVARLGPLRVHHLSGKRAIAAFKGCGADEIVVASARIEGRARDCLVLDTDALRHTGALALSWTAAGLQIRSVRDVTGHRLWSQWPDREPDRARGVNEALRSYEKGAPVTRGMQASARLIGQ